MVTWTSPSASHAGIKPTLSAQQFTIVETQDRLLLTSDTPKTN